MIERILGKRWIADLFNPHHEPGGSPIGGQFARAADNGAGMGGDVKPQEWTSERLAALRLTEPNHSPVGEEALAQKTKHLQDSQRHTHRWSDDSEVAIRNYFRTAAEASGMWGKKIQLRRELIDNYSDGSTLDKFRYKIGNMIAEAYRLQRNYDYVVITGVNKTK